MRCSTRSECECECEEEGRGERLGMSGACGRRTLRRDVPCRGEREEWCGGERESCSSPCRDSAHEKGKLCGEFAADDEEALLVGSAEPLESWILLRRVSYL
jgi:hypothetical protein